MPSSVIQFLVESKLNTLVLLPSSRYVDSEMQLEVGRIPLALIPVNGKPIIDTIIESYNKTAR